MSLTINLLFLLDASIIFVKNVLWSNIGKVHDVISVIPKLTAPLTLQKSLLHALKWRKERLQQARIPMKINKIFYLNCFYFRF